MQVPPALSEMLDSRREALEACAYWQSIDTNEAGRRLAEFEQLITELDREIDQAVQALSLPDDPREMTHQGEKK